jgi:hypothetical protein
MVPQGGRVNAKCEVLPYTEYGGAGQPETEVSVYFSGKHSE